MVWDARNDQNPKELSCSRVSEISDSQKDSTESEDFEQGNESMTHNKRKKKKNKNKKKKKPSPRSTPINSIPDDLLLRCFARVSRLYYPTLSLVSKSFRSLISSPELYKIRSSIDHTESCLYVFFHSDPHHFGHDPDLSHRWFTLYQKPYKAPTNSTMMKKNKKSSSGSFLAPLSIPHSPTQYSGLVAIGSDIYMIAGPIDNKQRSSTVLVLDCRSHTWLEAPSMRVERDKPSVNVLDGKIYVAGGCEDRNSSHWMEVFDPNTQVWESVSCPETVRRDRDGRNEFKRVAVGDEVYLFGFGSHLGYEPKEGKWKVFYTRFWSLDRDWSWYSCCVIDNVVYQYFSGQITWLETKLGCWRSLMGLEDMPELGGCGDSVKLVDYGGKLAVIWEESMPHGKMIWCAVITLERCSNIGRIFGNVEWYDMVLRVPESYQLENAISATV